MQPSDYLVGFSALYYILTLLWVVIIVVKSCSNLIIKFRFDVISPKLKSAIITNIAIVSRTDFSSKCGELW